MNTNYLIYIFIILVAVAAGGFFILRQMNQFSLPEGQTTVFVEENIESEGVSTLSGEDVDQGVQIMDDRETETSRSPSQQILITDDVKHSIPLNEILSGGPPKDGIPSIDDPKFWNVTQAEGFLEDSDIGLGLEHKGEARFYPFRILVWHEVVNDRVAGDPLLVTYCPLCLTGIVFERKVDGAEQEFGVSGKLWQSNLLMYNRSHSEAGESLWSQVLGEAVLGPNTGEQLKIITSDIVRWSDWKKIHSDTLILNTETGTNRNYSRDPYGDYYTNLSVSFGASFNDDRLHPKAWIAGIELQGQKKAYHIDALPIGEIKDNFVGKEITVSKDSAGRVRILADEEEIPAVWGFWFSWLAVHPETELYK